MPNISEPFAQNEEDIVFFAFRYALGRRTGAPTLVAAFIQSRFAAFTPDTLEQMVREIEQADHIGLLGDAIDKRTWMDLVKDIKKHRKES